MKNSHRKSLMKLQDGFMNVRLRYMQIHMLGIGYEKMH